MKYIFLTLILFLTSCTKEIKINNVQDINYKDISFLTEDYSSILSNINGKYNKTNTIVKDNSIQIITNNNIETFYFDMNKVYTEINNELYYKKNKELYSLLDSLYKDYTDISFFTIKFNNDFIYNEEKYNIKLNNTKNNYELNINNAIYNFKINRVNNTELELLYSVDLINNKNIVIRTDDLIEISFETKHGLLVTISKNNENFITKSKQIK